MRMLRDAVSTCLLALALGTTLSGCPDSGGDPIDPTEAVDSSPTPTSPGSIDGTPTPTPAPPTPTSSSESPTPTNTDTPTADATTAALTPTPSQTPETPSPTVAATPSPTVAATPTETPRETTPIPDTPTPTPTETPREVTPTAPPPTPTATPFPDRDGDGYLADNDCDDRNADAYPGAPESCDGVDNDCDGLIDDDDDDVVDASPWYEDSDTDGYGAPSADAPLSCLPPEGYVGRAGDCDDSDPAFNPEAPEEDCTDPADYNCDGETLFADEDGDGVAACEDCADDNPEVLPGAPEVCNGIDDNCDGAVDAADPLIEDAQLFYDDDDGDGYGDPEQSTLACEAPDGAVLDSSDCNDRDPALNPETAWYIDFDEDGYGADSPFTEVQCEAPQGYVLSDDDCDDTDPAYNPGALEEDCADAEDYNCDGSVGFVDGDGDGFAACEDCDDERGDINPGADELCNGVDDNCDGATDDADSAVLDPGTFFPDADGDGYGDGTESLEACILPEGYVADATDCDDSDPDLNPETTWYIDSDDDGVGSDAYTLIQCEAPEGYVLGEGDCEDSDGAVFPSATEVCNGKDDNCDALIDDEDPALDTDTQSIFYGDGDGDGFGDDGDIQPACDAPEGTASQGGDCDDTDPGANPSAEEICSGGDTDCDGDIDEGFDADGDSIADCFDSETCDGLDNDGDGFADEGFPDSDGDDLPDCLDEEECDGLDNDGDGLIDEGFADSDGDGEADCVEVEECDSIDNDGDGLIDEGLIDGGAECAAPDCLAILRSTPEAEDGVYYVDPDGAGGVEPFQVYCDMSSDGGGWTRLESAQWSHFFTQSNWDGLNEGSPLSANYSNLNKRSLFRDVSGAYVLRFTVGNSGDFMDGPVAHKTIWSQGHDPFTETTDGSDYIFLDGEESTTCGGFNGLHNKYQGYSMTSDPDSGDGVNCWWMQVVPTANYNGAGYLEGYGGSGNYHQWQALWIQKTRPYERCGDGIDNDEDGEIDEVGLGDEAQCPASDCVSLMNARPELPSGAYWLDPDGATGEDPFQVYCDLATDDGGWMRVMGAQWGHFFSTSNWDRYQASSPLGNNYSILDRREGFEGADGGQTLRLVVGNSGNWRDAGRAHTTIWRQGHDPFTETTDGSDYSYLYGDESSTCGGFNGLHDKYQGYSMTSDPDSGDGVNCWWMQVVPTANYNGSGYLEGYGGTGNYHQWQSLWMRLPRQVEECGNGLDDDGDGAVDEVSPGELPQCAVSSCDALLQAEPETPSGSYWLDPDGAGGAGAFKAYCEMIPGEGGWTRLESAHWNHFFTPVNWESYGEHNPEALNYSALRHLPAMADESGQFTFRFEVGNTGDWQNTAPAHRTLWQQSHDPFRGTTDGSDYVYISGDVSSTCGGFNGLHDRYQGYSMTSDPDSGDGVSCWWMQVVPTANYNSSGYLEGYGGTSNYHFWQTLWVR